MQSISTGQELKNRIEALEQKAREQELRLKKNFNRAYDSIKPQNLIRNVFSDAIDEPDIRHNLVNTTVGLISGFISRKIIVGSTAGIFRKLAGTAIQYGITKYISNNLTALLKKIQSLKNDREEEEEEDEAAYQHPGEKAAPFTAE